MDSGVKKAPDPGSRSATLIFLFLSIKISICCPKYKIIKYLPLMRKEKTLLTGIAVNKSKKNLFPTCGHCTTWGTSRIRMWISVVMKLIRIRIGIRKESRIRIRIGIKTTPIHNFFLCRTITLSCRYGIILIPYTVDITRDLQSSGDSPIEMYIIRQKRKTSE